MIEAVINGTIQGFIMVILLLVGAKFLLKKLVNNTKMDIKNEFEVWINSETGRIALYSLGTMLGSGLKSGAGFGGKGGKPKIEDIVLNFAQEFLFNKNPKIVEGQPNIVQNTSNQLSKAKKWFE